MAADAAEFYVDDAASAQFDCGARVFDVVNAFVETNWRFELALQRDVRINIVVAERLLDHDQVIRVELLQQRRVFQAYTRSSRPPSGEFAGSARAARAPARRPGRA